jgi:hypothetical protein
VLPPQHPHKVKLRKTHNVERENKDFELCPLNIFNGRYRVTSPGTHLMSPERGTYSFKIKITTRTKDQVLNGRARVAKHRAKAKVTAALADRMMLSFVQEVANAR